jgi:hypothetical protein
MNMNDWGTLGGPSDVKILRTVSLCLRPLLFIPLLWT